MNWFKLLAGTSLVVNTIVFVGAIVAGFYFEDFGFVFSGGNALILGVGSFYAYKYWDTEDVPKPSYKKHLQKKRRRSNENNKRI